jgi:hypothetical protein
MNGSRFPRGLEFKITGEWLPAVRKLFGTSTWEIGIKGYLEDHLLRTSRDNSPVATFIK